MRDNEQGKPRLSALWIFILLTAGILILGDLNRRMADTRRLERDAVTLETQVAAQKTENVRLQTQVAEVTSEDAIAEWAHSQAGMVRDGEVLVVPIAPSGEAYLPTPMPTPIVEPPSNWQVWMALLFGE
jgi:cell division protein FtsB